MESNVVAGHRDPWNKGKIVGQKAPFKLKDIWALRVRLQLTFAHAGHVELFPLLSPHAHRAEGVRPGDS